MTTTYNIATDIGKVRLLIGDTNIAAAVFTDEELQVFLTIEGGVINLAAADALEAWASKYGVKPGSESMGDYSYTQKIIDNMLALAKRLRDKEAATPAIGWAEMDLEADEEE